MHLRQRSSLSFCSDFDGFRRRTDESTTTVSPPWNKRLQGSEQNDSFWPTFPLTISIAYSNNIWLVVFFYRWFRRDAVPTTHGCQGRAHLWLGLRLTLECGRLDLALSGLGPVAPPRPAPRTATQLIRR